jgi:hypothetical protein
MEDFHFTLWILDPDFFLSLVIMVFSAFFLSFIVSKTFHLITRKVEANYGRSNRTQPRR